MLYVKYRCNLLHGTCNIICTSCAIHARKDYRELLRKYLGGYLVSLKLTLYKLLTSWSPGQDMFMGPREVSSRSLLGCLDAC